MTVLIGPCFSLSASGSVGKALLYYDTKFGARVRIVKRRFESPGVAWEINKSWFKMASDRAKGLDRWQKKAWGIAYSAICDSWRDIFMGKQIELWNLSPLNNITWPPVVAQGIGTINFSEGVDKGLEVKYYLAEYSPGGTKLSNVEMLRRKEKWAVGWVWFKVLNNAGSPTEADLDDTTEYPAHTFEFTEGATNYFWGGVRLIDGRFQAQFLGSFVK